MFSQPLRVRRTRGDVRGYPRFTLPRAGMFRPVVAKNRLARARSG
jgi:hypothetical protein